MILELAGDGDRQAILTSARAGWLYLRDLARDLALAAHGQGWRRSKKRWVPLP
jgi:hypothetical protein